VVDKQISGVERNLQEFVKRLIKKILLPQNPKLCRLRGGISRGLLMSLNLQNQLQRYLGLDEREIMATVCDFIGRSRTLVDVGANDGYYTLAFLRSNADSVVACEPSDTWTQVVTNAEVNGYSVGNHFEIIRTPIGGAEGCISVAELLRGKTEPIFIKVDVDGAELDVLQSAEGCVAGMDLSWIVEIHSYKLENDCQNWFRQHGYKTKIIDNAWWRIFIPELRPPEINRWILATPDGNIGRRSSLSD
jgi:predicted RNA methylase